MSNSNHKIQLGVISLAMISVSGIFTIRTLPLMAVYGFSAVFYYLLAALLFFIPSALTCAELATGWPKTGGMYVWIREALGPRLGFLAIWLEWTNTVISFPATLAFIVATFAYAIDPTLAQNKVYLMLFMLAIFWGMTFVNFLGIKYSSWLSNFGLIFGTILPLFFIVLLSIYWIFFGNSIEITFSWREFFPNSTWHQSAFLVSLLLGFAGMQIAAFHAQETKNPQRDYPRAMLFSTLIILLLSIFGSLAISIVIPQKNISVITGLMQAFTVFFTKFHLGWCVPIIAILTAIGTLSSLNIWMIGPAKGLLATARYGDLPPMMQRVNRHGAPTALLLSQGVVGTLFALVYLWLPDLSASYWILVDLTALLTLIMYVLIFASVIRLRYIQPDVKRAYKMPGGKLGVWLIAGTGMIVSGSAFFLGFFPPSQLETGSLFGYEAFLIIGLVVIASIPFLLPNIGKKYSGGL